MMMPALSFLIDVRSPTHQSAAHKREGREGQPYLIIIITKLTGAG